MFVRIPLTLRYRPPRWTGGALPVLLTLFVAFACSDSTGPSGPVNRPIGPFPADLTGSVAIVISGVVTTSGRAYTKSEVHVINVADSEDRIIYEGENVYVQGLTWAPDNSRIVVNIYRPQEPGPNGENRDILIMHSMNLFGTEERVIFDGLGPEGHPAYSAGGRLAYFAGWSDAPATGIYVDGRPMHHMQWWDAGSYLSWSPDGTVLVYTGPSRDGLNKLTLSDGNLTQLLHVEEGEDIWQPAYSPDGLRIALVRFGGDPPVEEIWTVTADGSDPFQVTPGSSPVWTPGGTYLAFVRYGSQGGVYMIPPAGGTAVRVVGAAAERGYVSALAWSW